MFKEIKIIVDEYKEQCKRLDVEPSMEDLLQILSDELDIPIDELDEMYYKDIRDLLD